MTNINSRKRISINIVSSVIQVLVVGLVYLLLYKFLLKAIGIEQLGIWSIILATTSVANLANFGITSGLVKFIADYNSRNKTAEIQKLIFTSFISIFVFFSFIILIVFLFSRLLLGYVIEPKYLTVAFEILPYSLLSLFLNSLGSVFTSTLEGLQKNYLRNFLVLTSSIVLLLSSYYLTPKFHLKGVAFAQVIQAITMLIGSFIYLKKEFGILTFKNWNWDISIFKELINFGLKFQVISLFQMMYEPITKGLISKFGGLALLGYYEMAARLVNQIRALIVNANQVMIPVVAHTVQTSKQDLVNLYKESMTLTLISNIILTSFLLVFTPIISILWVGFLDPTFVFSMIMLSITMFINIMISPAYFGYIGEGKLNTVLIAHVLIGILNISLGVLLGNLYKGNGVIISWCISVTISSVYLILVYQKKRKIKFDFIFTNQNILIITIGIIFSFLSIHYYNLIQKHIINIWLIIMMYAMVFTVLLIVLILNNHKIKSILFNKKK